MDAIIVHINFAKTWRGGERQVVLLYHELHKMGFNQKLFCQKGSALHKYSIEHDFEYIAFLPIVSYLVVPLYICFFRLKNPLIIHCHESKAQTLGILGKYFSIKNIPLVVHRRVVFPIKQKITTPIKYNQRVVDKIICISRAVEKVVKESIGFKSTVVVPSSVPLDSFSKTDQDIRKKFNIGTEKKIVTYIAALTFEKDHHTFFKAAREIVKTKSDVHFLIIGDGPLRNDLENEVGFLGLAEFVTFTGFLSQPEEIIPQLDLLLFTSRYEGLGSTILDFFVHKKPVVSVSNAGAKEIVENGKTGLLSPIGDFKSLARNVNQLFNDPKMTRSLTNAAYDYVLKSHSPLNVALKTIDVYRSMQENS